MFFGIWKILLIFFQEESEHLSFALHLDNTTKIEFVSHFLEQ